MCIFVRSLGAVCLQKRQVMVTSFGCCSDGRGAPKIPNLTFEHHKAILQLEHNTASPKSSSITTTRKPHHSTQKSLLHYQLPPMLPPLSLLPPPLPTPPPLPLPTLSVPPTPTLPPTPQLPPTV